MTLKSYPTPAHPCAAVPCPAMAASASELGVVTTYPDGSFTLEPYPHDAVLPVLPVIPYSIANPNAGIVPAYPKGRW